MSYEENLENIGKRYKWRTGGRPKVNPGTSFNDGVMKSNQELIFNKLRDKSINNEVAIFLAGYAIITEYETLGQMARATLQSTRMNSLEGIKPWERESVVQFFFTIEEMYHISPELNCDHRSEICHIRNAFAHSHIKFMQNGKVELWDFCKNKNNFMIENFRECYSLIDLLKIYQLFGYRSNLGVFYAIYGYYLDVILHVQEKIKSE